MKRELKLDIVPIVIMLFSENCRAYPDEKGIETFLFGAKTQYFYRLIAEPIPMKRELKPYIMPPIAIYMKIAEPIPMKRELKQFHRRASMETCF